MNRSQRGLRWSGRSLRYVIATMLCIGAAQSSVAAQRRTDSAGTTLVEHVTLESPRVAFRIDARPLLLLGGLQSDPQSEFDSRHGFLGTLRLSDGRVVVNDYSALKVFDAQGRLLRTIGRRGNGPGEFLQTRSVCHASGNALIVLDFSLRRASVFTLDGAFVRTVATDSRPVPLGGGCFRDGSLLMMANARPNPRSSLGVERGRRLDRVADFRRVQSEARDTKAVGTWPIDPVSPFIAPMTVHVVDDRIFVGDSHRHEVRQYDSNGKVTQVVRWRGPRTRITPTLIEQIVRGRAPASAPRTVIEQQIQLYSTSPVQDELPGFLHMLVDPLQRVWLEEYPITSRSGTWTVLSRDGGLLGRVRMPRPQDIDDGSLSELVEVLEDRVALRWRDRDGAVVLSYHAIVPSP